MATRVFGRALCAALLVGMTVGAMSVGVPAAGADEQGVLRRIDEVLAATLRVEERMKAVDARLERLEARLADVEVFLQRADERAPRETAEGATATPATPATPGGPPRVEIPQVYLMNRRLATLPDTGDEYLVLDVEATVRNLARAGRIHARFHLTDRFGVSKRSMDWTTGMLRPGDRIVEPNVRFRVTRSAPEDVWLRSADIRDIKGRFEVIEVLYGVDPREVPAPR